MPSTPATKISLGACTCEPTAEYRADRAEWVIMYHITAYFTHGATADCRCESLDDLVAYLTAWLPLSLHVTCREIPEKE